MANATLSVRDDACREDNQASSFARALLWGAQAARALAYLDANLLNLEGVDWAAAAYFRELNPSQWALYPHYHTTPLCGWKTTNFVESEQARALRLKPRKLLPFEFSHAYSKILMGECWKRLRQWEQLKDSGRLVTQQTDSKLQQELKQISRYQVAFSSADVCYVSHRSSVMETDLEVNLLAPNCPCPAWKQFGLPCRHLFAALDASDKLDNAMLMSAPCYTTATYGKHLKSIRLPSEDELVGANTCCPPHMSPKLEDQESGASD